MRSRISTLIIVLTLLSLLILAVFIDKMGTDKNSNLAVPVETPKSPYISDEKLYDLIQAWRTANNLQRYEKNTNLCILADKRLDQIKDKYGHNGFAESVITENYFGFSEVSENINRSLGKESDVLSSWLGSKSHYEALVRPYLHSCVKCLRHNEYNYCIQIFAKL